MVTTFLHRADQLAEGLLAPGLIQIYPALDHLQLQQLGKDTLKVEGLEEGLLLQPFPL